MSLKNFLLFLQQISSNSLHFLFICLMVLSHLSDHMNKIAQKLDLLRAEQEAITSMLADWGCWQGRVHIKDFPMLCQGTLLKLGHALHETPFSNWNHEKKWWFSVVFTQNQVKLCGSAKFWLEARESSLCLAGSCFVFHVPLGFVSQSWNLGFRWRVQNE